MFKDFCDYVDRTSDYTVLTVGACFYDVLFGIHVPSLPALPALTYWVQRLKPQKKKKKKVAFTIILESV